MKGICIPACQSIISGFCEHNARIHESVVPCFREHNPPEHLGYMRAVIGLESDDVKKDQGVVSLTSDFYFGSTKV